MLGANVRIWVGSFGGEQLFRIVKYPGSDYKLYANYGKGRDNLFCAAKTSLKSAQIAARDSNLARNKVMVKKHLQWKSITK